MPTSESVKTPFPQKMGASVVQRGEAGAGNLTKLRNQIVLACNIAALAEALMRAGKPA